MLGDVKRGNGDPEAARVQQDRDAEPALAGQPLPAAGQRAGQLRRLDPGALLDQRGHRPRLRHPQLGRELRRALPPRRLRHLRRDPAGRRLPVRSGPAPAHLLLQLRRDVGRHQHDAGPQPDRRGAQRGEADRQAFGLRSGRARPAAATRPTSTSARSAPQPHPGRDLRLRAPGRRAEGQLTPTSPASASGSSDSSPTTTSRRSTT